MKENDIGTKDSSKQQKKPFFKPKRPYSYDYQYKEVDPNLSLPA